MRAVISPLAAPALAVALAMAAAPAAAERADRGKPMVVEADRPGTMDLQRQIVVFNGNVVITQGTMVLRADRVELREQPDGYRAATALGTAAAPAAWRQRRDGVDETVEGSAQRIDFDGRTDTLRLSGNSTIRLLRAGRIADEISGGTIVWNNLTELFEVEGGQPTPANPSGRVRIVLSPRAEAASAPSAAPPTPPDPMAPLAPSRSLGGRP